MPLVSKSFSDIITFTRASSGTYFDATGTLQTATTNNARFDYDPSTLAARGMLVEEQRTNLLTYSAEFDNAAWTKSNSTVSANTVTAPSGAVVADAVIENAGAGNKVVINSASGNTNTGYTLTFFVKAAGRTQAIGSFRNQAQTIGIQVLFDLSAVTATTSGSFGSPNTQYTPTITSVGNGWFRCSLGGVLSASSSTENLQSQIYLSSGGNTSYTGDGASGLYVWGAQLEAGAFPTSYIATTAASATRSADVASVNTLSPWYNASAGTLYADAETYIPSSAANQFPWIAQLDDGTTNNKTQVILRVLTGYTDSGYDVKVGGVSQATFETNTNDGAQKKAVAIKANDFAFAVGGTVKNTDSSGSVPTVNRLCLGNQGLGSNFLNGYIRRITYYPRRLSNAELQGITT